MLITTLCHHSLKVLKYIYCDEFPFREKKKTARFLNLGLFHRAITQSGSSLNGWALERDKSVGSYSKLLAEDLGCPTSVSSELMACLRTKPVRDMVLFRKKIEVIKFLKSFEKIDQFLK